MMPGMSRLANLFGSTALALALVGVALLPTAAAQPESALLAPAEFEALLEEFLAEDAGFEPLDADELEFGLLDMLPETDSAFLPTGALEPFTKAVMVIEMVEGRLERSRYQLTLQLLKVDHSPSPQPGQAVLVTAERYNVGPVIHAQLVEELGEESVAPVEEFGVGPDTAWRFVMQPLQGHAAMLMGASRKELTADEAAAATCGYGPCLSLELEGGPDAWDEVETPPLTELAALFQPAPADFELLDPEVMMAVVNAVAGFDPYLSEVSGPGREIAHAYIDQNLGQGPAIAAILVQRELLDDSLAAIWTMAVDVGFAEARSAYRAFECRRGDDPFAPPGSFCP